MEQDNPDLIHALTLLGAHQQDHSGRTLLQHLTGVSALLRAWGNPEAVCNAGLFHSIYGTSAYQRSTLSRDQRQQIQRLIGDASEQLVYLFSVCDQRALLVAAAQGTTATLRDSHLDQPIEVPNPLFCALMEIGVANLIEQLPHLVEAVSPSDLMRVLQAWSTALPYVSQPARDTFSRIPHPASPAVT